MRATTRKSLLEHFKRRASARRDGSDVPDIGYSFDESAHPSNRYAKRFQDPMWGYLATFVLAFFVVGWLSRSLGMEDARAIGFVAAILAVVLRAVWLRQRRRRKIAQDFVVVAQMEEVHNDEKELQIARAKARGDFERFGK